MIRHTVKKLPLSALLGAVLTIPSLLHANAAPSFSLPGLDSEVSLEAKRGRMIYLDFWASWCTPCRKSFPWMTEIQSRYAEHGLEVIAVNLDETRDAADAFLNAMETNFTVAFDPSGRTADRFNVIAMPSSYLIDENGNILQHHLGFKHKDKGKIEQSIKAALGLTQ